MVRLFTGGMEKHTVLIEVSMTIRDQEIWDKISIVRNVGEKIDLSPYFEKPIEVVSNETFAYKAIQAISQLKYFYHIEAPIMYCLHYGIAPSDLNKTIELVKNALRNLGWIIKKGA